MVAVLAIILIALSQRQAGPPAPEPVPITNAAAPEVSAFPAVPAVPESAAADQTTGTTSPPDVGVAVLAATADALAAWGVFAVDGDLDSLRSYFWEEGPQWSNLEADAAAVVARQDDGPAYDVAVANAETTDGGNDSAIVDATVIFSRPGELDQQFEWRIELRSGADGWKIWAVDALP